MLPRNDPDRIQITFDDHRLVANAGLLLPTTLAQHLGLRELVDNRVDLGAAPRRANTGDKMLPLEHPDRIQVSFDDHRLVANAGLLLPVTLAQHLGLREFVDSHVDLGDAPGRANTGDKIVTLVASAMAGGDCIDDADALRTGRTARVLGCVVKAPSTLGTFLRSFRWGHVRQVQPAQGPFHGPPAGQHLEGGLLAGRRTNSRLQPAVAWAHPTSLPP